MQWKHSDAGMEAMKQLFGDKLWTDDNPFYAFHTKVAALFINTPVLHGSMSQMFARKVNTNSYQVWGQMTLRYKESIDKTAFVLFKCRYNKVTGALTQIELSHSSEYATKTEPFKARRTGTVDSMFAEVAAFMGPMIKRRVEAHWKGFTEYYAEKVKNMSGYYLD